MVYDEKDDSWLISLRYQSAIVKVDRSTGEFVWILGEPSGWNEELQDKLFTLEGDGRWFYFQHSPTPTPNGNFLVYDNGNFGSSPFDPPIPLQETYSRVVEYELDEENMTAKQVWTSEIPGEEKVFTFIFCATIPKCFLRLMSACFPIPYLSLSLATGKKSFISSPV